MATGQLIRAGFRIIHVVVGPIGPDLFTAVSRQPPRPVPPGTAKIHSTRRQRTRESDETRRDLRGSKTRPRPKTTYQPLIAFPSIHLYLNPPDPFIVTFPSTSCRYLSRVPPTRHRRRPLLKLLLSLSLPLFLSLGHAHTPTPTSTARHQLNPHHCTERPTLHACTTTERLNVVPERHGLPGRRPLGSVPFPWPSTASTTSSRGRGHADAAHGT